MAVSRINMECKRYGCMKNLLACYANCRYNGRCDDLRNEVIDKADQAAKDINDYLRERGRAPITIQVMKRGLKFTDAPRLQKSSQESIPVTQIKTLDSRASGGAKTVSSKRASLTASRPRSKRKKRLRASTSGVRTTTSKNISDFKNVSDLTNRKSAKDDKPRLGERHNSTGQKATKRVTMARKRVREESIRQERAESSNGTVEERAPATTAKVARSRNGSNRKRKDSLKNAQSARKQGKVFIILEGKSASLVDEQGLIAHLLANHSSGARYFEASEVEARLQIVPKR
jgi:hypothetical protein